MNPRREMERRTRQDSYDRGARAAFLGEPGDLPAGLPRYAALRWMRGYREATAVRDGTAQRGTRAERNRAAISTVLPDLGSTRGVEVVKQLVQLPAFLRCDCALRIGEIRADGYVICDECDGIMVVPTLLIVDNDDVGLPGPQDRIGLEASRLMWQREIDAVQTQLRKATEELAQQRQPRLRILPREPGDAA